MLTFIKRTKGEAANNQQAIEELFSPRHSNGGLMASRDCDPLSSNFNHSEYGISEFNLLHKKTTNQKKEGKMNGKVRTAQLHAAPAFGLVIDAETPAQDTGSDQTETGKQQKKTPVLVPSKHLRSSENHLGTDKKQFTRRKSVPDNCNANDNHNSSSSRSSMSSGDASSSQIAYLTVSDISLRTQPLQVPPPSRLPPSLVDKEGYPKARVVSDPKAILDGVSEYNPVSAESLSFLDVGVDVSSATAISTAAIQEVMELAQAKLKSKKELMEKKCDIPQTMKKMSCHGCISSKEKLPQNLVGQNDENLASADKRNQLISADKLTLRSKEKEKDGELLEDGQTRQGNDLRSPKLSKSADKSEKWKINKEYHELVNTEKFEMIEEVSEGEGSMKKAKLTTMISEVNQHKSMQDTLSYEIESNWKLKKDIVAPVACAHEENAILETHDIHLEEVVTQGVIQKLNGRGVSEIRYASEKVHLFSGSEKNVNDNSVLDYVLCNKRGKKKLDFLDACGGENSSNFVEINVEEEIKDEKWKSKADACQGKRFEKEIDTCNLAPHPSSVEGKLNMANATAVHEAEIQVSYGSCISKVERTKGAYKCTVTEKARVEDRQCNANNVNEIEKTAAMREQLSATELKRKSLSVESELRAKGNQETYKDEEDLKDNRSTVGITACEEQDYKGYTAKQAQSELQQRDKKDAAPESCNLEKFEGHKMDRRHLWNLGNEDTIEIQVEPYFMDKYISINVIPAVSAGSLNVSAEPLNTNLHDHPTNLSEDLSMLSNKCHIMDSDQIISDIQKSEDKGIEQMEKETEEVAKEERRVEEEKEILQEENEKIVLLQSKLVEDVHTVGLLEERSNMEEKKEQAILLEETKERETNLKEEKEQARLMEESSKRKNKIKDEVRRVADKIDEDKTRLSEQANGNQKNLQEEVLPVEAKERERKVEEQKERERLVEEQKEREREREKDRIAMARAFAEATERAENIAVGKVTTSSEVWQRILKESQVKSEMASYESFGKSLTENASRDSKLWTECATSKQATAEAHDCAVERAGAERASADAREDSEKDNTMSRDKFRMDSTEEHLQAGDKVDEKK